MAIHMEVLFGHLAAGLGGCRIVKNEDAGGVITDDSDIQLPDYRLTLKDGRQIFVEVKNHGHLNPRAQFLLSKNYVERLQRYGEMNNVPIYFAIYYRCLRMWALLPVSSFIELKKKYSTNAVHSIANSEMSMLGDLMVGTKAPLVFELVADTSQDKNVSDDNQAHFIIGDVKIYCAENEVTDYEEKNLAFYLMRFGRWDCGEPEAIMDDEGQLHSVRFTFNPDAPDNIEREGFDVIGHLSSMITEAFNEQTVYERQVTAIDTKSEPEVFSVTIPKDYKGETLPLWRFSIQPNPDFKGDLGDPTMYELTPGERIPSDL
ncbi:MAG: hypothetical protein E6663_10375 [Staphylococcus lugdunensis]|uniref:hypothetical protein n=2 Tax=Pantoea TaxID=53335 RepID=UPI002580C961|nr:hypothetical protein [Pantoea sp.]MDU6091792.1 hypothetical protein [Staphylococcus lugdunensis]